MNTGPLKLRSFTNATPRRSTDVPVSEDRLADFDDLAVYFGEHDNRQLYDMVEDTPELADLLVKQLKQYARVNKLTTRPEQDEDNPCKVSFRFVPKREKTEGDDDSSIVAEQ